MFSSSMEDLHKIFSAIEDLHIAFFLQKTSKRISLYRIISQEEFLKSSLLKKTSQGLLNYRRHSQVLSSIEDFHKVLSYIEDFYKPYSLKKTNTSTTLLWNILTSLNSKGDPYKVLSSLEDFQNVSCLQKVSKK